MKKTLRFFILSSCFVFSAAALSMDDLSSDVMPPSDWQTGKVLEVGDFLRLAAEKDTVFEEILIDELFLQYRKDLLLPPGDLVLGVKSDYEFLLIRDQDAPNATISLSKLFPYTGTSFSAEYTTTPDFVTVPSQFSREQDRSSEYTVTLSQPIAENAFGKVTRLRDKIIGLENDIATHQIVEAYEDYLAAVMNVYLDWYEAFENLKVATSSYQQNLKLLENMKDRQKNNIALPIDVNKITLQVMAREERLIEATVRYRNALNLVHTAIRHDGGAKLIPEAPKLYDDLDPDFQKDYDLFQQEGRTFKILRLLEQTSALDVKVQANQLLPSIDLKVGFTSSWDGFNLQKEENLFFAGISLSWPIPDEVERAQHETAKLVSQKSKLTTENVYYQLFTDIKNLYEQIERERRLLAIAEKKIELSQAVFDAEAENYSFGKISLNDYIDSVNALDSNRFNRVFHLVQQKKLIIEALRLLDRLITEQEIRRP